MSAQQDVLAAAQRGYLKFFLLKVFETLHPGTDPLQLAWYLQAVCHVCEEMKAGSRRRQVITVPPRHLKSITVSIAFVAWCLGHDPTKKFMVASYSQELARLHAQQCRRVMESAWYQALFPATRLAARSRTLELTTTAGGVRKAVSVGGTTTGFGADIIIIDDCMKADDVRSQAARDEVKTWYGSTLFTRLNSKREGCIISIQQRLHEDDLPALLLEKGFDHLNLPAIAEKEERIAIGAGRYYHRRVGDLLDPAREDQTVLDQMRHDIGPVAFSAQYQQDPITPEGNLLRWQWFGTYDEMPSRSELLKVVQSWDTGMTAAPTSDYSVCTTWGFRANKWLLLDVFRERLDYPDLKAAVVRLQRRWHADKVVIEDAGSGKSLAQDLRLHKPFQPLLWPARQDKEERFIGTLGEVEAGNILLPVEAPWLDAFRSEMKAFPQGRHDDQVDSFSQFVHFQLKNWRWTLTHHDASGRPERIIRRSTRPW